MTLNEAIEMTESLARYIRKFPNILLSVAEIERIIGINRTACDCNARRAMANTHER